MSKVHRFGSQFGWQKHNLRWPSAFPARAKQVELLFGFREELALRKDTVNGRWSSGLARQTNKDIGAGWQVWMGRTTHKSTKKKKKTFPRGGCLGRKTIKTNRRYCPLSIWQRDKRCLWSFSVTQVIVAFRSWTIGHISNVWFLKVIKKKNWKNTDTMKWQRP